MISFFKQVGRYIKRYFIFIGILSTVMSVFLAVFAAAALKGRTKITKDVEFGGGQKKIVLHLKLSGAIAESSGSSQGDWVAQFLGEDSGVNLERLRSILRIARYDSQVKGLFLEFAGLSGSLAGFSEFRDILREFRDGNKAVVSWLSMISNKGLYLASVGDKIVLAPVSDVSIPGPVFSLTYFGDAIRKLGIGLEVVRSGKYKSAFEPFVKNNPSTATIEMYDAMEESLRGHLVQVIGSGRSEGIRTSGVTVDDWLKQTTFTSSEALKIGIVDSIAYRDEALNEALNEALSSESNENLRGRQSEGGDKTTDNSPQGNQSIEGKVEAPSAIKLSLAEYAAGRSSDSHGTRISDSDEAIGLIEAVGEIRMDGSGQDDVISPEQMHKQLKWAMEEEDIKAVVIRVSSPGGSAIASDLIWHDVAMLAAKKPVVVSMGAYAASGGYYISAPATKIVAQPTTITGSIGVIGMVPNFAQFREKYGVSFHTITKSERKSMLDQGTKLDAADRAIIRKGIDEIYNTFVAKVAKGRSMSADDVDAIAQGRVWTGSQGMKIGLVDRLGGMKEAYQEAKSLAGLDVETLYNVRRYQEKKLSLEECVTNVKNLRRCLKQEGVISGLVTRLGFGFDVYNLDVSDTASKLVGTLQHGEMAPGSRIGGVSNRGMIRTIKRVGNFLSGSTIQTIWPGYLIMRD